MSIDIDRTIEAMSEQETRLIELMSQRPLDIWPTREIVRYFPLTPSHDLSRVAGALMDKRLVLIQRSRLFDERDSPSGLVLTELGARVGTELTRRSLTPVQGEAGSLRFGPASRSVPSGRLGVRHLRVD